MERQSVIAERCTTCGSLLPCVLHDRELKRAILRESGKEPSVEMTWTSEDKCESVLPENVFWLSATRVLKVGSKNAIDGGLTLLERVDPTASSWTEKPLRIHADGDDIYFISSIARSPQGKIYLMANGKGVYEVQEDEGTRDYWTAMRVLTLDQKLIEKKYGLGELIFFPDGSCFLTPPENQERCSMVERLYSTAVFPWRPSLKTTWPSPTDELHLRILSVREAYKLENGEVLLHGTEGKHFLITKRTNKTSAAVLVRELKMNNGTRLPLAGHAFSSLGAGQYVFEATRQSVDDKFLFLLEEDPQQPGTWKKESVTSDQIEGATSNFWPFLIPFEAGRPLLQSLSPNSFLFGDEKGRILLWTKRSDDRWTAEELGDLQSSISSIAVSPYDQLAFFVTTTDGNVSYWCIPPGKLQAYHEARAAQSEVPTLPLDI